MIPFANELIMQVGEENFQYAVLQKPEAFRLKMGFNHNDINKRWVLPVFKDADYYKIFENLFLDADVVLFSSRKLFKLAKKRLSINKLTFYFSERWFKPKFGKFRLLHPKIFYYLCQLRRLSKHEAFHYLSQGGFAYSDIKQYTKFKDRVWSFGYFTETTSTSVVRNDHDQIVRFLWCGRMLKWKQPSQIIQVFEDLLKIYPNCHLTLIGDGPEKSKLLKQIGKNIPKGNINVLPFQEHKLIRREMSLADIFVLTSTGFEGWGAVINEAMAEGCAVICSQQSGVGKSIIVDSENGLLYDAANCSELKDKMVTLAKNYQLRMKLQEKGNSTIVEQWSPFEAAIRFSKLSSALLNKEETPHFKNGPFQNLSK
jgi:glycosyltransferase involved in cell wall biosynthesis